MKIVYCIPSLYISGGMERVLTIKANYFADVLGYDITIVLTDGTGKPPYYDLSPKIEVVQLDVDFEQLWSLPLVKKVWVYLKKQREYKIKLTDFLTKLRPDITVSMLRREINFINSIPDGSVKIGEIHINRQNFRDLDGQDCNFIKKAIANWWMKQLVRNLKRLKLFVCLTEEDKAKWTELSNVIVMPNPLSFSPSSYSDCSAKCVIAVGRYVPQKGFDMLIKAWGLLAQNHTDWSLYVYGEGERDYYQKIVKDCHVENSCHLEGPDSEIEKRYEESSIFVLSSRFEGFGVVIVEAMSCGIPPVSFACPCGPCDIITDGKDGLLVKNGNIEQLAKKISFLMDHEEKRKQMGYNAIQQVQRYKIEYLGKQWKNIFENLVKK